MGREDSHYRPDGSDGQGTGRSRSGGATGRVPVPEAHLPRTPEPPADQQAQAAETLPDRPPPPPWRPPVGSAPAGPSSGRFPVLGGDRPVSPPAVGNAAVPASPAPGVPSSGAGPTAPIRTDPHRWVRRSPRCPHPPMPHLRPGPPAPRLLPRPPPRAACGG
ncbi:hypothetical protein GCM10027614_52650 [Micromonospora vulcania]